MNQKEKISELMAGLKEEELLGTVRRYLDEGVDPLEIINQCHRGMVKVGELYARGKYFISGLIMAGEIMRQVSARVFPLLDNKVTEGDSGRIVLGTVEGDIHFIGKDIFKMMVRGYGFTVHDLGVDVPPANFLAAVNEFNPDIVGLSCLISTSYQPMEDTINLLKKSIPRERSPRSYVIGGRVDQYVCQKVGADYWTDDSMKGVLLCRQIMAKNIVKNF